MAGGFLTNEGIVQDFRIRNFKPTCNSSACSFKGLGSNSGSVKKSSVVLNAQNSNPSNIATTTSFGGFLGNNSGTVDNCFVHGIMVKDTSNVNSASGFVQFFTGGNIAKSYSALSFYGAGSAYSFSAGSISGIISDSYLDTQVGSNANGISPSGAVAGLSEKNTSEMKNSSTFVGWDFVNTWQTIENSYLELKPAVLD
jgi:hypothetical protein